MGALSFKDCIAADIQNVFLNQDEFAEVHTVDGRPMGVILDDDGLQQRDAARGGVHTDGLYKSRRLIYLSKADYGGRPVPGKALNLDGRVWYVVSADEDAGMLTIELEANRT